MALLTQPKERRKNRSADRHAPPQAYVERYAKLRQTLLEISNMTKREMPDDDEFRLWAQNLAHEAITYMGDVK